MPECSQLTVNTSMRTFSLLGMRSLVCAQTVKITFLSIYNLWIEMFIFKTKEIIPKSTAKFIVSQHNAKHHFSFLS